MQEHECFLAYCLVAIWEASVTSVLSFVLSLARIRKVDNNIPTGADDGEKEVENASVKVFDHSSFANNI